MRPQHARGIPRARRHAARIFTAPGERDRQRIVLMFERDERLTIGQIDAASALSRSAVAHHLKVTRDAGVLHATKVGREVWYRPDADAVSAALAAVRDCLEEHFSAGTGA